MILAGDIGGTKTVLALYPLNGPRWQEAHEIRYPSGEYESLEEIISAFLDETEHRPHAATFGVAGPVIAGSAKITNLPWTIDAATIAEQFQIPRVHILNDLAATATAVPHLTEDNLITVHPGVADPTGVKLVIAPGTGLGEAFLIHAGERWHVCPTEGGHASFAPGNLEQVDLAAFLERRHGHVSVERVASGSGIPNLYDFLIASGRYPEPDWLKVELDAVNDRTPMIMDTAIQQGTPICVAALDLFVRILGGEVGNMALNVFATGGVYLGGGLPPRMVERLREADFRDAMCAKGRFRELLEQIPVHIIMDPKAGLHGAAWDGLDSLGRQA